MDFWRIINLTERTLCGIELRNYFEAVSDEITSQISIEPLGSLTFKCRQKPDMKSLIELKAAIVDKGFTIGRIGMDDAIIIEHVTSEE